MGYLSKSYEFFSDRSMVNLMDKDTDLAAYSPNYFPKKLFISLTSRCNLLCRHCFRTEHLAGQGISREMLDHIIEDFFPRVSAIKLGGSDLGEQLLSPHFTYFLGEVEKYPIDVDLSTSAVLVTRKNVDLIASTVSFVSISIEAMGKNYEAVRGWPWDKFLESLDLILEARERISNRRKLRVGLAVTVMREYKNDCRALVDFSAQKGIDFIGVRNFIPRSRDDCGSSLLYYPREHNRFFKQLEQKQMDTHVPIACPPRMPISKKERKTFPRKTCSWPFEVFGILTDGKIHPCCASGFDLGFYEPGYAKVMERWTSPNFVELREKVNSDEPLLTCSRCEVVEYNPLAYRPEFPGRWDKLRDRFGGKSETVSGPLFGEAVQVDWRIK